MPRKILLSIAALLFVAAIAWPTVALVIASIQQAEPPREGFSFSTGQLILLGRTFLLSLLATLLAIPIALLAGINWPFDQPRPVFIGVLAAGLICPPMIYSFGWLRIFPQIVPAELRCILGWVIWAWPIGAIIVGAGWSRAGREAHEAATLCTSRLWALGTVGVPAVWPFLLLSGFVLFVLFFGDYGMPHGFGIRVFSTELLAWSSESSNLVDVLWPALLPAAITAIALVGMLYALRRCEFHQEELRTQNSKRFLRAMVLALMVAGWALPLLTLSRPLTQAALATTWKTYRNDLGATLGVTVVAAILIGFMGLAFALFRPCGRLIIYLALLFGTLPGAVVSQAMIAAYNHQITRGLYDNWAIISLAYTARYAWIGLLAFGSVAISGAKTITEQAQLEGATDSQVLRYIVWPQYAPLLVGVAGIVIGLSIGDVATVTPVRVPYYQPIASLIIDKFHQFQDEMLISLSLMIVGVAAISAGLVAWIFRGTTWFSGRRGGAETGE